MDEIWKDIPGFEGLYQASNLGNVYSLAKLRADGRHNVKGKALKPLKDRTGYLFVYLWKDRASKPHRIHRLVLAAFVGPRTAEVYANHKNGIRDDNRLENLEWVTPPENNVHAYQTLGRAPVIRPGEKNGFSKLTREQVAQIRELRASNPKYWTLKRIGDKFGIVKSHVKRLVDRSAWRDS